MSGTRDEIIEAFLDAAGVADATREALPGDASTRRYVRLTLPDSLAGGRSLMLMDQPPGAEAVICQPHFSEAERLAAGWNATARLSGGSVAAFVAVADHLRAQGLSAPEVIAFDAGAGLALIEDLGDGLYARVLEAGEDEERLYRAAVEVLAHLHETPPPRLLAAGATPWPVLDYDGLALKAGADLFVQWWPQYRGAGIIPDGWDEVIAPLVREGEGGERVLVHRDYHAENLLWLDGREGLARTGLIDFQDALAGHASWDLHSLLQDARRDVPSQLQERMIAHYLSLRPQVDEAAFRRAYRALATLNALRILGIFARLVVRDGKTRYAGFMGRMWGHLDRNLAAPELEPLRAWLEVRGLGPQGALR